MPAPGRAGVDACFMALAEDVSEEFADAFE